MLSSPLDCVTAAQARFLGLLRAPGRGRSGLQSTACPLFSHPSGPLTPQGLHHACAGLGVHVRGCSLSWEDVPHLSSGRVGWAAGQGSCSLRAKGASSNTRCCEKSSCLGSALPSLFSKPSSAFSLTSFICLLFCIPFFYFFGFLLAY